MDDVEADKTEHNKRLAEVLKRIAAAGVTLNQNKCLFGQEQLEFLGHVIDKHGSRETFCNSADEHPHKCAISW